MRKPLTHMNFLPIAKQFIRRSSASSLFLSLVFLTLVSCSYLEDFVEPDNPKPGEEKMFRPVTFNRPILPVHASANEATFIDPTVKITGAEHILLGRKI